MSSGSRRAEIAISMSRPGNPYDNAKAESFMKTLKTEEVNGKAYANIDDASRQIGDFIETVYNRQRLHSALGYKPPVEFEAELRPVTPTAKPGRSAVTQLACLTEGVQSITLSLNRSRPDFDRRAARHRCRTTQSPLSRLPPALLWARIAQSGQAHASRRSTYSLTGTA